MDEVARNFLRLQTLIPGPVSEYGESISPPTPARIVVYDCQKVSHIPSFVEEYGGSPEAYRDFIRLNQTTWRNLKVGQDVLIPGYKPEFSRHPEG